MKSLQDTLYNWLTIKVVADAREDDESAQDTEKLFYELLTTEHGLTDIKIEKDQEMYFVHYSLEDARKSAKFPVELIDVMLQEMESEPDKFINYPK